jgi:DNA-binding IclR family transcriptional regulator
MDAQNKNSSGVKTTEKSFELLETVRSLSSPMMSDLVDETGMAKSTIYDHLQTLKQLGYVVSDGNTYSIGLQFLNHGTYARNQHTLTGNIKPTLETLAGETGEIVWAVVEENGYSYILETKRGEQAISTVDHVGFRTYLHLSSSGKAIMAYMSKNDVKQIIERRGLPGQTEHTITSEGELFEELEEVRDRGYAYMDEEAIAGLRSVASPIVVRNKVLGAVSVAGPAKRLRGSRFRDELPNQVQAAANAIELEAAFS